MSLPLTPLSTSRHRQRQRQRRDKDKDKILKRPNMCYIFEKLRDQGYQIWHWCIISASSAHHQFIISASSAHHQRIISASSAHHHQCIISASSDHHQHIISASSVQHQRIINASPDQTRSGQRRLQSRGPNSRNFVLVQSVGKKHWYGKGFVSL